MAANPKITGDTISVERPTSRAQLEEFARLPFQVYGARDAWWPPDVQNEIDLLSRRSLLSAHLEITPFCARRGGSSSRASARLSIAAISNIGMSNSAS